MQEQFIEIDILMIQTDINSSTNTNKYRVRPTKAFILPRVVKGWFGRHPDTMNRIEMLIGSTKRI